MAHWGDWALQQFNFRIIGEVSSMDHLKAIFGDLVVQPREQGDAGVFNKDPSCGKVNGFMCMIDLSEKFIFSVCAHCMDDLSKC